MTTDTVLGIGGPVNKENKEAINLLKDRPKNQPLIILVADLEQARSFKEWSKKAEELANRYWPGEVTLALNDKVSLRMPNNTTIRNFIKMQGPIYSTSANKSGDEVYSMELAKERFQEIQNYYYFGKGTNKPSKIIRVTDEEVIR